MFNFNIWKGIKSHFIDETPQDPLHTAYLECEAMMEYAQGRGFKVSPEMGVSILDLREEFQGKELNKHVELSPELGSQLFGLHNHLTDLVQPARPWTIFKLRQHSKNFFSLFGAVPTVRLILVLAVTFLFCLILLTRWYQGDPKCGIQEVSITQVVGEASITNEHLTCTGRIQLIILCAAGLGACFSVLYRLQQSIRKLEFDAKYENSAWTTVIMGLMAGYILVLSTNGGEIKGLPTFLKTNPPGVLIAILGGFSAEVVYKILTRMIETLEQFFIPGSESDPEAIKRDIRAGYEKDQSKKFQIITKELGSLQSKFATSLRSGADDMHGFIDSLLDKLDPDKPTLPDVTVKISTSTTTNGVEGNLTVEEKGADFDDAMDGEGGDLTEAEKKNLG